MTELPESRVPPRPERPTDPVAQQRTSLVPVILAVLAAILVCGVLFFLTGGFIAVVIIMAGLIGGFAALHYVVWGWWLGKLIEHEEREP